MHRGPGPLSHGGHVVVPGEAVFDKNAEGGNISFFFLEFNFIVPAKATKSRDMPPQRLGNGTGNPAVTEPRTRTRTRAGFLPVPAGKTRQNGP